MRHQYIGRILILLIVLFPFASPAYAQSGIRFTNNQATIQFPESITFKTEVQANATVSEIELEYGVDQLTCGTVIAKVFPEFDPSLNVQVEWTWEMRQSGSLPPGAIIWWRWVVTDMDNSITSSEKKTITWLDQVHDWQTISGGDVKLHWYSSGNSFGQELYTEAVNALSRLAHNTGLQPDSPIHLYIYANTQDMRAAILYEPGWTGGMAFPEHNIVIIGISPDQVEWGKRTEAHEITHVLVGHLTFSCLGYIPTWLNEGLAVYGEGGLDSAEQTSFEAAARDDTLISIRSLSGGFSEVPSTADLSYSESYSIVKFLIDEYGQQKVMDLLVALRDGETVDNALLTIYEFNIDGLEDAWRAGIGARPRSAVPNPTATPQPTTVPTIIPFSGALVTPAPLPTNGPITKPENPPAGSPAPGISLPFLQTLDSNVLMWGQLVLIFCIIGLAIIAGPIIITARRRQRRKK